MPWTSPTPELSDGPMTGDDRPILEGVLAWHRATLLNICAGLTGEQLAARPVPPSSLSLLGLVRHMAKVERIWLRQRFGGQDVPPLHGGPGHPSDFADLDAATAEEEVTALVREWELADDAVRNVAFTHEEQVHGEVMSLRMVYVHMVTEYARHLGHADLLRECLDGVTGR